MAIRKKLSHDMKTREKIQTSQIINRLEKHILAKPEKDEDGNYVVKDLMSQSQVSAALGLIKKTLPDLSAIEHSGEVNTGQSTDLSDAELDRRIIEARERIAALTRGSKEQAEGEKVTH